MKRKILNLGIAALFLLSISTITTSCGGAEQKQETHEHEEGDEDHHEHDEDSHDHK
ncbi:MAG: hypothetical protein ACPGD5_04135 [Salibacteraceae bacterium]